jgi:hypothetical protein
LKLLAGKLVETEKGNDMASVIEGLAKAKTFIGKGKPIVEYHEN